MSISHSAIYAIVVLVFASPVIIGVAVSRTLKRKGVLSHDRKRAPEFPPTPSTLD